LFIRDSGSSGWPRTPAFSRYRADGSAIPFGLNAPEMGVLLF
jgi:hypothetical protein